MVGKKGMTAREKLQLSYELAFYPPRLNQLWRKIRNNTVEDLNEVLELLDMAMMLHLALPEAGYSSQRALKRLAVYQANSRAFALPRFLRNIREKLGRPPLSMQTVPGHMVRDIGLPPLSRSFPKN